MERIPTPDVACNSLWLWNMLLKLPLIGYADLFFCVPLSSWAHCSLLAASCWVCQTEFNLQIRKEVLIQLYSTILPFILCDFLEQGCNFPFLFPVSTFFLLDRCKLAWVSAARMPGHGFPVRCTIWKDFLDFWHTQCDANWCSYSVHKGSWGIQCMMSWSLTFKVFLQSKTQNP